MKFVCDNCATQYLISDDKVGPKGVKVRCKRCGNIIIVRPQDEEPLAQDEPGRATTEPSDTERGDSDEVGQAFDQLLAGGLGDERADEGEDEGDEQATEIFRVEDLKRQQGGAAEDRDKIDEVFAGAESTELSRSAERQRPVRSEWYLAIGEEQVGPMDLTEVQNRWLAGEIDTGTLAWSAGMSDWTPLSDIDELNEVLQSAAPEGRESTAVDEPEAGAPDDDAAAERDDWAPYQGSELASLVEEEIAETASQPPPSDDEAPLAALGAEEDEALDDGEIPPWEQDEPASGEVAQPSDSFFDSSLDKSSDDESYFGSSYSRSGHVLAGPAYLGGAKASSSKGKWILITTLVVVVIGGGTLAGLMLLGEDEVQPGEVEPMPGPAGGVAGGQPTNAAGGEAEPGPGGGAEEGPGPDKGDGTGAGDQGQDGDGAEGDQAAAAGEDQEKAGDDDGRGGDDGEGRQGSMVVAKPAPRGEPEPDRDRKKDRRRRRRIARGQGGRSGRPTKPRPKPKPKPKPKPQPEPAAAGDAGLPEKLTKSQISKTMRGYIKAMKGCVEQQHQRDPTVTGTMKISFVIQPSGKVSKVSIKTAEHRGSYVAGCISYIIKSIQFPKAQKPFVVPVLPLKLGG
jgi:predicted Zn finger-like uncharacterized protein